jgi:4-hydroxy-tetrahydrodipicolinate synthase
MGAEDLAGIALLMGADGCVSGVGNFEPELIVRMYEQARQDNVGQVKELQYKAARLRTAFASSKFWLSGLKYICSLLGLCEEYISEPFPYLTEEQKEKVRAILKEEDIRRRYS